MARIKIELPGTLAFSTEIPVLLCHINNFNHLDNAQLLGLVSEARTRFMNALGYEESNVDGAGVIVADAALQYRSEAFHGEIMVVAMGACEFHDHGCDLVWQMSDKASGREVARGKTGIVFYDYAARRKTPVPVGFSRHFAHS
jgi:acyl-CoA thioester hydrolase